MPTSVDRDRWESLVLAVERKDRQSSDYWSRAHSAFVSPDGEILSVVFHRGDVGAKACKQLDGVERQAMHKALREVMPAVQQVVVHEDDPVVEPWTPPPCGICLDDRWGLNSRNEVAPCPACNATGWRSPPGDFAERAAKAAKGPDPLETIHAPELSEPATPDSFGGTDY